MRAGLLRDAALVRQRDDDVKPSDLLQMCADRLELLGQGEPGVSLFHPKGTGRFPFTGGGTERINQTTDGVLYWVPVARVLTGIAKMLKV